MPQVSGYIPNLVNGVSQQAPALRLPSQCEIQENYYSTLVDGLVKRPRTDWLAQLIPGYDGTSFTHFILRDKQEKYVVVISKLGVIRVFGLDGTEYTVTNEHPEYLQGTTDTQHELRALTIADFTFIANRKVKVLAKTTTSATRPFEALYYVITGNYSKTYRTLRDGSITATFTTPDSSDVTHEPYVDTTYIADQLFTGMAVGASQAKGRYHSTVYFRDTDTDFTASMQDGYGGRASKCVKGTIQKFSDLPSDGPDGFVVKVAGNNGTNADDYYVKLENGIWKETVAPNTKLGLDKLTMPHALIRNSDGTFTFKAVDWTDRVCGDEDSNPNPSFVGQTIQDVFFYRNRLGFLTSENFVMSEAGKFYNFYRTTQTTALDTDPIDGAASHVKVSLLRHAIPTSDTLLLFSDQTQFRLSGNETFTPKSVSARPLTELTAVPTIPPVAAKNDVFFIAEQDKNSQLYQYFVTKDASAADVSDASSHVPAYIPSGVRSLAASPDLDLVVATSDADPQTLYVYKYYFQGQEKLQSAWSKWTFPETDKIMNFAFDGGALLILLQRRGNLHVEKIRCEQRVNDAPLSYNICLDQLVKINQYSQTYTYNAETNRTTITLPYKLPVSPVMIADFGGPKPMGTQATIVNAQTDGSVAVAVVVGDWRGQPIKFGIPYRSLYRFSPFFYRAQNPQTNGKTAVNENGRLQVMHLNLVFARTAQFRVEVQPEGRSKRTYHFNGRRLSDGTNLLNEVVVTDGHVNIPIMSRNDRVTIDLINDTWLPVAFEGAEWKGTFHPSTREL